MRNLFLIILAALVVFSQIIQFRSKGSENDGSIPSIYWVTDSHPSRKDQVRIFREWLKKKGYPDIEVKLDTANQGLQKTLIQGVTGVAGDLVDVFGATRFLADTGMVEDLEAVTKEFSLNEGDLFQPTYQDLCLDGKRYATPKNIGLNLFMVNLDLFDKLGLAPPPQRWDFDSFEKIGLAFDKRANQGLSHRQVFFASTVTFHDLRKTAGVSTFNETLTACAMDNPVSLDVLKRLRRWREDYHIIPSDADKQAVSVGQGYGDSFFQLFNNGQCALLFTGRWALIQIRAMKKNPRMSAVEMPNGGYPCITALAAAVVTYKGSRHKEQAKYFQAYMMSDEYNRQILKDVDSLPPCTRYMDEEEFLRPAGYANEWPAHKIFREVALTITHGRETSPFIITVNQDRIENRTVQGFMAGAYTAEKALALITSEMNADIQRMVSRREDLRERYEKALQRQKIIDAIKAKGEKIPLDLVDNPYLKRYYRETGRGV